MEIKENLFVVMTKDRKKIMKGLSKSIRFMEDLNNETRPLSTFSMKSSAEAWVNGRKRIEGLYPYNNDDLEVVEVQAKYSL